MPANRTHSAQSALKRRPPLILACTATIKRWYQRSKDRAYLRTLDADRLRDIGLSPDKRNREASKPFWKA